MRHWKQPKENSIEALRHGILFGDGVEFDLRVDGDGELVIVHDEFAPGEEPIRERCVEKLPTDYLKSAGIPTLDDLLANREFSEAWQSGGKTVDIEFKLPHPSTKIGTLEYLSSIMGKLEESLKPLDLPDRSAVVSCFSPKIAIQATPNDFTLFMVQIFATSENRENGSSGMVADGVTTKPESLPGFSSRQCAKWPSKR